MRCDRGPYASRLDEETWAFVDRTDSFYPPDAIEMSVADQRAVYDRMCRAFRTDRPEGVTVRDETIVGNAHPVPMRIYTAAGSGRRARIVYYHGGGFVVGGLDSHDDVCAEICAGTGCEVVSVDYRLSPEHRHPAAFEDALAGFRYAASGGRVVLCGDSAGGNLAAAVSHATRGGDRRPVVGQVLIYPGLGGDSSRGSYVEHAHAPMLTLADVDYYETVRTGGERLQADPALAPLADTDFSGLPPTVVFTAECDPLSGDGPAYRSRIVAAGGKAVCFEEAGLVHGYLRARHSVGRARASFARIVAALDALAEGRWPYG